MIRYAGNPASFWVNGSVQEKFTFVPGNKLYFVAVQGNCWIPISLLLLADDEEHVRNILKEMCEFRLACEDKYLQYAKGNEYHAINHVHGINLTHNLLKLVNGDTDNPHNLTLLIQEQPTNQFFKVGWGDTIL